MIGPYSLFSTFICLFNFPELGEKLLKISFETYFSFSFNNKNKIIIWFSYELERLSSYILISTENQLNLLPTFPLCSPVAEGRY